uniref:Uncharacterized protein n=1 Tax=Ficedula albicollis TaxID=59894 RepID=A0A803VD22_FICAL
MISAASGSCFQHPCFSWLPTGASWIFLTALPTFPREIKLRNYDPEDAELKKRKLPPAKPASVEDTVKEQLEAAKPEPIIDEVVGKAGAGIPGNPELEIWI